MGYEVRRHPQSLGPVKTEPKVSAATHRVRLAVQDSDPNNLMVRNSAKFPPSNQSLSHPHQVLAGFKKSRVIRVSLTGHDVVLWRQSHSE